MNHAALNAHRQAAAIQLQQGQALEARGTVDALAEALSCYDRAIAALALVPASPDETVPRDHGIAWMNRGSALLKQATPASVAAAVTAYDSAIALLTPLSATPALTISLGAAWLNRGQALLQLGPATTSEAIRACRTAIDVLTPVAATGERWGLINHAAAWLNLAHAFLLPAAADPREAAAAARTAVSLVAATESTDPVAADVGLKARRALCDAIGQLLVSAGDATGELAEEAADTADSGLALVRHWEARGMREFRPLALRLYRFGARLCLVHQPHFLAEFLLESLTPDADPALHAFAAEFIPDALATLRATSLVGLTPHHQQRLHEAVRELAAASARLAER